MMSGSGKSSNVPSVVSPSMRFSVRTSPRWWPMKLMSMVGMRWSTS